ncbi:MAG: class II aldolase/adducin family protein [Chloroflexia bacterium]
MLNNHGVVAVGQNLRQAANAVEILDRSAWLILWCYALGKRLSVLPEEAVRRLRERGLA